MPCSLTRSMHLEALPNQETTTFLGRFKRMVARRGRPAKVFSDNEKTFVGAARWLKHIQSDEKVQSNLSDEGIAWSFNLSRAPWWGGRFERLIGFFKRAFYKTIGGGLLFQGRSQDFSKEVSQCDKMRILTRLSWLFRHLLQVVCLKEAFKRERHRHPKTPWPRPCLLDRAL